MAEAASGVSPSARSRPRSPSAASSSSSDAGSSTSSTSNWQRPGGAVLDEQFLPRLVSIFFAIFHPTEGPKVVYQVPEGSVVPEVEATPAARGIVRPRPLFDFAGLSEYIIPKEPLCGRLVTCTARALQMPRGTGMNSAQTESEAPRSRRPSSVRHSRPPTPQREATAAAAATANLSHPGAAASSSFKVLSHPVLISDEAKYARNTFIFNIGFVFDGKADVRAYEPVVRKCARQLRALEEQSCFLSSPLSQTRMYAVLEQLYEDLNSYCESFIALPDAPHTKYLDTLAATGSGPMNALQAALGRSRAGTRTSAGRSTGPTTPLQQSVQERAAAHAQAQGAAERQAIAARRRSSGGGSTQSGFLMTRMTSMTEAAGVSPMAIPEHSVGPVPPLTLGESSVAMRRTPSGEGNGDGPRTLSSGAAAAVSPLSAGVNWTADMRAQAADSSALASSSTASSDEEEELGTYEAPSAEAAQLLASRSSSSASGASATRPMLGRAKTLAAVGLSESIVSTTSAAAIAPVSPVTEVEALPALSPPLMLRALSHEAGLGATGAGAASIQAAKTAAATAAPPSATAVNLARSGSGASRSSVLTDPQGSARRDGRSSAGSVGREASILSLRTITVPQPSLPAFSTTGSTATLEARPSQPLLGQSLGALAPALMLAPGKREPPHGLGRTVRDAINLKLFPTYANPPPVYDWQVPVALLDLARHADGNWDLTMAKIFPFIDGVNHVKRIAQLADADIDLTRQCMEHLLYYGCIIMIDIFQFFNMYTLRPLIATMAEDASIQRECAPYVTRPGHTLPSWPKLLHLYSALRPGITLHEWIEKHDVDALGIDVRRFITFGVIKGFLRRVHRYPILLGPVAQPGDEEASSYSHGAGLGLHQSTSGILQSRDHSGSRERPTLQRSQDTARPLNHPTAPSEDDTPLRRRRREPSETGSMITLVDAPGTSPNKRHGGSRKRTSLHRHATATAIDVASYALDMGAAAAASEARYDGDADTLGPPSARVSIRSSPLRSRPSQSSLPRGRGSASVGVNATAGTSTFSRAAESDGKATSSISVPPELPTLLDGTRPDDELCVHFGIPWSELHQLLAHVGRMPYDAGTASARARSGEREAAAQATSEWAEEDMANASGFGHFGAMSGWGPIAGGAGGAAKRGGAPAAQSGAGAASSGWSRVGGGARNGRRRSSQYEGAAPQSSGFSRRSSKAGAAAESSATTTRGASEWTRTGAHSSLAAFESEEGTYGTAVGSAWALLDDKETGNVGDYGRVRIILQ